MLQLTTFEACLDEALAMLRGVPGLALEFGVCNGDSLRRIAAERGTERTIGFDWFNGLPENWRDGFPAGTFRTTPPEVPGAELIIGLYADTLAEWEPEKGERIVLVHIDCDLYSSTRDVLNGIGKHLKPGCLIVFDEYHGYPGHEDHEAKAWTEWAKANKVKWTEIAAGPEQLLIRLEPSK